MPNYRRYYIPNSIIFITQVTRDRVQYLESFENLEIFWETLRNVQKILPYNLLAYVILPDHFHFLIKIDDEKGDFSKIMHSIKRNFTFNFKGIHDIKSNLKFMAEGILGSYHSR